MPFVSSAAGTGAASTPSASCTAPIVNTDNVNYGDNCTANQIAISSPQGVAVDKYGNIYIPDYSHKQVRVVYNGNPLLAAAITAANSGYTPLTHAAPAPTPVVGSVYTLVGTGTTTLALSSTLSSPEPSLLRFHNHDFDLVFRARWLCTKWPSVRWEGKLFEHSRSGGPRWQQEWSK